MSRSLRAGALLGCLLLVPTLVHAQAQASIAGIVRDTSGAVLPGVTIEASSPELIEKVRSAITDASGQYRIENLRPGACEEHLREAQSERAHSGGERRAAARHHPHRIDIPVLPEVTRHYLYLGIESLGGRGQGYAHNGGVRCLDL